MMEQANQVAGIGVKCPNCKRVLFETTDKFDPGVTPNGSMVKFLKGYALDWLTTSTTGVSEMTCPECLAQLAPSGRLLLNLSTPVPVEVVDELDITAAIPDPPLPPPRMYPCPTCGKKFDTKRAMSGHKGAAHTKEKVSRAKAI
jgi:DNA-directed RNA polymerase subunit RPC12/RpoP